MRLKHLRVFRTLAAIVVATVSCGSALAVDHEVRLEGQAGSCQLTRNGEPYFVRGVGGAGSLELLAKAGGNSVRTWGDDRLGETLDAAHKLGLTVTAGIWLGQVRQGFDWTDANSLLKQRKHVQAVVQKYGRHPALLAWALGNEMEDPEGRNAAVWSEINNLARLVKAIDPRHPTMTVIAELGGEKVRNLHTFCPDLDLIGINSYAGASSIGKRYRQLGGKKPYLLTEFGPPGIWETEKNELGAFPELTSTQKAEAYRQAYQEAVLNQPGVCLGSYAFVWGRKQEVTATWFSLLTDDGERLEGVDVLQELWTGRPPANRCPTIQSLKLDGPAKVAPGKRLQATLQAADVDQDSLKTTWYVQYDPEEYGTGGDLEATPPTIPDAITRSDSNGAEVAAPMEGGLYRLFVVVKDGQGGAAVANVAFRVDGPVRLDRGRAVQLPLTIYAEDGERAEFVPAGWMGNAKAIKLDPAHRDQPQSGETCLRCEYGANQGWGGVVWQSPANDWGDRRGGCDLSEAKRLTFWARGETGAEVVSFSFGLIGRDKRYFDTAKGELPKVSLTREWKQYEIPVAKLDLSRIKTGFVWTAESAGRKVVFYLDAIRWER